MMLPCDICGKSGHPWFDCAQRGTKPIGWKPERLSRPAQAHEIGIRYGTKFIAEVPEGTKLIVHGDKVIAAGPNLQPSYVTDDGLVPIKPKKPGRPATGFDKKAYDRAKAAERRAAAREAKK